MSYTWSTENPLQNNVDYPQVAHIDEIRNIIDAIGLDTLIVSGLTAGTSSGLSVTISAGVAYYNGTRYSVASDGGHTYTASEDTYIDVNPITSTYTYTGVANNASQPAITANTLRLGKVITNGTVITGFVPTVYTNSMVLLCSPELYTSSTFNVSNATINFTPMMASKYKLAFGFVNCGIASDIINYNFFDSTGGTGNLLATWGTSKALYSSGTMSNYWANNVSTQIIIPTSTRSIFLNTGGATANSTSGNFGITILGYIK